jgi:hypothetical protein
MIRGIALGFTLSATPCLNRFRICWTAIPIADRPLQLCIVTAESDQAR